MIPPRHYTIESSGKRDLYLTWDSLTWKNFIVMLDGKQIAKMEHGARELADGREFRLPGGARLKLLLKKNLLLKDLHVFVNDKPVPNTPADPDVKVRRAANALYFISIFDVVLGLIAVQSGNPALTTLGFGWTTVAIGMVLFSLAMLVRKGSLIALFLAIGLYLLDTFLGYYITSLAGLEPEIGIIVARLLLLVSMAPAVTVIWPAKTD
ncbi:MAG: hypothetical protein WAM60_21710 [Candidatus Promineifilaceae bacterium]